MEIKKKIWPKFFEDVSKGKKNFEIRLNDFKCNERDVLVLQEWNPETKNYTGREIKKEVKCIIKNNELKFWKKEDIDKHGFQIIGF